jgi:lysosomal alpha-mannosidase
MSTHYVTGHLFVPFGGDFQYVNAYQNYKNIDAMMEYMSEHHSDKYNLIYSTPSKYVDAIAMKNVSWPTKYDDMFPYSDGPDAYWTGYFSSRANDKEYVRRASHNFHASMQLYSEKVFDQNIQDSEVQQILAIKQEMLDVLGINQHHDAVSGTGKQRIADDYALRLYKGMKANAELYNKLIGYKVR